MEASNRKGGMHAAIYTFACVPTTNKKVKSDKREAICTASKYFKDLVEYDSAGTKSIMVESVDDYEAP